MDIKVTVGSVIVSLSYGKIGCQLNRQKYLTVVARDGNMLNMKEITLKYTNN